jgi:PIN domain nuclease of toxin-antitoxin system
MRLKKLGLKPQELRSAVTRSGLQTLSITDLHAELAAAFDWITAILETEFSPHRHG